MTREFTRVIFFVVAFKVSPDIMVDSFDAKKTNNGAIS